MNETNTMIMNNKNNFKKFSFSNIYMNRTTSDNNDKNNRMPTTSTRSSRNNNTNNNNPMTPTKAQRGYVTPPATSPSQRHGAHSHKRTGSVSGNILLLTPPDESIDPHHHQSYPQNYTSSSSSSSVSNTPTKKTFSNHSNNTMKKKSLSVVVPNDIDDLNTMLSPGFHPMSNFLHKAKSNEEDGEEDISSHSYTHELSPKLTIQNTNEQIRRNSVGTYSSLTDFVKQNHINVDGRIFVDSPQAPKINLDI